MAPHGTREVATLAAAPAPPAVERYSAGVAMVLAGILLWSLSGLLIRSLEAAGLWQLMFWRSLVMALCLLVAIALTHGFRTVAAFRAVGWPGVAAGLCFTASSVCFVSAVVTTTVANASFLAATTPLFAAILAWMVGRERVGAATWAAIGLALSGIAVMFADGLAAGHLLGNLLAIGAAVAFAGQLVILRERRRIDMVPAMALGGLFTALLTLAVARGDVAVGAYDLRLLLVMGSVQLALPLLLFTRGSRHVPAVQLSLLVLLDAVFNPLWVLLVVDEVPGFWSLLGGAILLAAIAGQTLLAARRPPDGNRR